MFRHTNARHHRSYIFSFSRNVPRALINNMQEATRLNIWRCWKIDRESALEIPDLACTSHRRINFTIVIFVLVVMVLYFIDGAIEVSTKPFVTSLTISTVSLTSSSAYGATSFFSTLLLLLLLLFVAFLCTCCFAVAFVSHQRGWLLAKRYRRYSWRSCR